MYSASRVLYFNYYVCTTSTSTLVHKYSKYVLFKIKTYVHTLLPPLAFCHLRNEERDFFRREDAVCCQLLNDFLQRRCRLLWAEAARQAQGELTT